MIVDTSVLVAILMKEESAAELLRTLVSSETNILLSAAGYLETSIQWQ